MAMSVMRQPTVAACPVRMFSSDDKMHDKAKGDEKQYFSREDAKALQNLMKKYEEREQEITHPERRQALCEDLMDIFKKYGLDQSSKDAALYQELLEWKRHHD
jgi:hypothetical protein